MESWCKAIVIDIKWNGGVIPLLCIISESWCKDLVIDIKWIGGLIPLLYIISGIMV